MQGGSHMSVDILCIGVLGMILVQEYLDRDKQFKRRALRRVFLCGFIYILVDMCLIALEYPRIIGLIILLAGWFYWNRYFGWKSGMLFLIMVSVLQYMFQGFPVVQVLLTLTLFQVYILKQKKMISTDPLTRLGNRRQLKRYLDHKIKRLDGQKTLYLFMMDVDNLKRVNDQQGHLAGDELLENMAAVLRNCCKENGGYAFRYGGDEFVMTCELGSEEEVNERREYLKKQLHPIQVSIGYAKYMTGTDTVKSWIQRADQMLYQEKC